MTSENEIKIPNEQIIYIIVVKLNAQTTESKNSEKETNT